MSSTQRNSKKPSNLPPIFSGLLSSLPFPVPANIHLPFCLTSYLDSRSAASSPLRTYTRCNQTHGDGEDTKNHFVLLPFYHFLPPPKTPLPPQPALTDHHHHYPITLSLSPSQPPDTPFLVLTLPCIRSDFIHASPPPSPALHNQLLTDHRRGLSPGRRRSLRTTATTAAPKWENKHT